MVDSQAHTPGGETPGGETPGGETPGGEIPKVWSPSYWNKYWSVWILLLLWAIPLVVFLAWGRNSASLNPAVPSACNPKAPDSLPGTPPDNPAVLKPHTTVNSGVPFGRFFDTKQRDIDYDVTANTEALKGARSLAVEQTLFQTASGSRQLDESDILAWAEVKNQNRVLLHVCFKRDGSFGSPGTYIGTVNIIDSRVARIDVPFNVSLNYPVWQFVLALWLLMLLPATLYVWLLLGSFTSTKLTIRAFKEWIYSRNAIIALGTGATISFGFVLATYFKAESWGSDITEATALFGGAFAGFVAAAAGVTSAGQDKDPAKRTEQNSDKKT
jgi:hypothetical protein